MRQPFYRIQYPEAMFSSNAGPDVRAGNHVILLAAPGWSDVPLPLNSVWNQEKREQQTEPEVIPYLLFRGGSALTLLITIIVNGREKRVPVGTTSGKLLSQMGICKAAAQQTVIYRRSPFGEEAMLTFTGMDGAWDEFPLFHGDRIEG